MSELIRTEDGSLTMFDTATGELYHNRAGAYTEALRNYFEPSAASETIKAQAELRLLDACFGLGYNTFVLIEQLLRGGATGKIKVAAVEIDPTILEGIAAVLADDRFAYSRSLYGNNMPDHFGEFEYRSDTLAVSLHIMRIDLRSFVKAGVPNLDLVFHDPFSPRKVPELWTVDILGKYYQALTGQSGRVLTYSVAPAVRGGLSEAGFRLYRTTAVGGKSGGTLAFAGAGDPLNDTVFVLSEEEVKRWRSGSGTPYRDPQFMLSSADILAHRAHEQASRTG